MNRKVIWTLQSTLIQQDFDHSKIHAIKSNFLRAIIVVTPSMLASVMGRLPRFSYFCTEFLLMARTVYISIVCMLVWGATYAQTSPLASDEQEIRNERLIHFSQPVELRRWEITDDTVDEWKDWELVDNYSFGINRGALPMIADLESLHPYFRDKVLQLIRICRSKGIELALVETYRTHAKQTEYRTMGRRYTRTKAGHSKHQYGLAVDIVPMIDSLPQWKNYRLWRKIGPIGEQLGLRWGGRWSRLYDPCHFEWTGGLLSAELAKGKFPSVPKPDQYPCLEEDIKELRRHWKSWETEQAAAAVQLAKEKRERLIAAAAARLAARSGGQQ